MWGVFVWEKKLEELNFESFAFEMVIIALAALYLLIASKPVLRESYFDILLYSALILFALLLMKYFGEGEADTAVAILLQTKSGISSCTLLVCIVELWQYLKCKDKLRSFFYMGVLITVFLVLLINQRASGWFWYASRESFSRSAGRRGKSGKECHSRWKLPG